MSGVVIVGAGPLIGTSVARRFVKEGATTSLIARTPSTVEAAVSSVRAGSADASVRGFVADVTDEAALRAVLDQVLESQGVPDVVLYNAAWIRGDHLGDLSSEEWLDTLAVNVVGGISTGSYLAPRMVEAGGGSLFFTGGMPTAKKGAASLSVGKAGLRTVADLFRAEYAGENLHVATVTVCDVVRPGTAYDPDLIAEVFHELHHEERADWRTDVIFQREA